MAFRTLATRGLALLGLLLSLAGAAQAQSPGNTPATAIALPGIQHETDGVSAEYVYIREHFPGWKPGMQALISAGGRHYDRIELTGPDGATQAIFFDITDWFGK